VLVSVYSVISHETLELQEIEERLVTIGYPSFGCSEKKINFFAKKV
jgi:hypothetical protein